MLRYGFAPLIIIAGVLFMSLILMTGTPQQAIDLNRELFVFGPIEWNIAAFVKNPATLIESPLCEYYKADESRLPLTSPNVTVLEIVAENAIVEIKPDLGPGDDVALVETYLGKGGLCRRFESNVNMGGGTSGWYRIVVRDARYVIHTRPLDGAPVNLTLRNSVASAQISSVGDANIVLRNTMATIVVEPSSGDSSSIVFDTVNSLASLAVIGDNAIRAHVVLDTRDSMVNLKLGLPDVCVDSQDIQGSLVKTTDRALEICRSGHTGSTAVIKARSSMVVIE